MQVSHQKRAVQLAPTRPPTSPQRMAPLRRPMPPRAGREILTEPASAANGAHAKPPSPRKDQTKVPRRPSLLGPGFMDTAMLRRLLRETSMSRTELFTLFNRFKALCKLSGSTTSSIDKKTFKDGVATLAFEDDTFADRIFQAGCPRPSHTPTAPAPRTAPPPP
jgi:hypothetical protein